MEDKRRERDRIKRETEKKKKWSYDRQEQRVMFQLPKIDGTLSEGISPHLLGKEG